MTIPQNEEAVEEEFEDAVEDTSLAVVKGAANGDAGDKRISLIIGVSWNKSGRKWEAKPRVGGKQVYLGMHLTEEAAAQAIDSYVKAGDYTRPLLSTT
jgi:hypothetical protein